MLVFLACLARHGWSHWSFQFLSSILNGFFELTPCPQGQWNKFLVIFWHYRVLVFHLTIPASPSAWHFFPILSRVLAINNLAWMLAAVLSVSPDHIYPSEVFLPIELTEWNLSKESDSWSTDIPIVINAAFLHIIQIRSCSSGDVNVFESNREWFFSRRVKFDSGFDVMAVYEVSWHGPKIIYRFTGIWKWVLRWWKRPFWFSKKIPLTFSSNWMLPVSRWVFPVPDLLQKFDSSICGWKNSIFFEKYYFLGIESFRVDLWCVHRFQLLNVCNQYVTFQIPPAYRAYPRNNPRKTCIPNWWILDLSFAEIGQ